MIRLSLSCLSTIVLGLVWSAPAAAGLSAHTWPHDGAYGAEQGRAYLLVRKVGDFLQVRGFDQASAWSGMCSLKDGQEWSCQLEVNATDSVYPMTSVMKVLHGGLEETWRLPTSDTEAKTLWRPLAPEAPAASER